MDNQTVVNPTGYFRVMLPEYTALKIILTDPEESDIRIDMNGDNSSVDIIGAMLANKDDVVDVSVEVNHNANDCTSSQVFKGIAADKGKINFKSKVVITKGTTGNEANQANHNILLSKKASVDSRPELEIYADDVKCSHGVSTGQLDQVALYYLTTRGLSREEAINTLLEAFIVAPFDDKYKADITQKLKEFK